MADTLDSVTQAYMENADYDVSSSPAKCRAFISACRKLLLLIPDATSHSDESGSQDIAQNSSKIENEIKAAKEWLSVNDDSIEKSDIIYLSSEYFRG